MSLKSYIKTLIERRIFQILGSYLFAGTSLILFIQYLVDKYQFPSHYPTLALFALSGILPSVVILAYFHGAPGKDEWTKVEKVGIPINVLFIASILFFGDSINIWEIEKDYLENNIPNVHLIYIGSLEEDKYLGESVAEHYLSINEGADIFSLNEKELKYLRLNIESDLYSEFYNQNLSIKMVKSDEQISFINNAIIKSNNINSIVKNIYEFFEKPKHFIFVRVYAIKSIKGTILQYVYDVFGGLGGDYFTKRQRTGNNLESIKELEAEISDVIAGQIIVVQNDNAYGEVINIEDDYVYINPKKLNLQNNMNLTGYRKWSHNDNDGDGFTDKDSYYYKWINDVKEALDYMNNSDNYSRENINFMQKKYDWLTSDSLRSNAKGESWGSHTYSLKVVSVKDSIVVTKLIELSHPWVKINIGDGVRIKH